MRTSLHHIDYKITTPSHLLQSSKFFPDPINSSKAATMYTPTLALIALSALFTTTLALPQQRCFAGLCYPNIMDPSQDPAYKKWPKPKPKHEDKNHLVHDRAEPAPSAEVASTMADEPGPLILAGVCIDPMRRS